MSVCRVIWASDWRSSASTFALVPEPDTAGVGSVAEFLFKCGGVVTDVFRLGITNAATFVISPRVVFGAALSRR